MLAQAADKCSMRIFSRIQWQRSLQHYYYVSAPVLRSPSSSHFQLTLKSLETDTINLHLPTSSLSASPLIVPVSYHVNEHLQLRSSNSHGQRTDHHYGKMICALSEMDPLPGTWSEALDTQCFDLVQREQFRCHTTLLHLHVYLASVENMIALEVFIGAELYVMLVALRKRNGFQNLVGQPTYSRGRCEAVVLLFEQMWHDRSNVRPLVTHPMTDECAMPFSLSYKNPQPQHLPIPDQLLLHFFMAMPLRQVARQT